MIRELGMKLVSMISFILVHGNWGGFGAYETCSKSCGGGTQKRYRSCNNPAPAHGGRTCAGLNYQFRACNTHKCPSKLFFLWLYQPVLMSLRLFSHCQW